MLRLAFLVLALTPVPHSCSFALLSKTVSLHAVHSDQSETAQSCLGAGVGLGTNRSQLGSAPDHFLSPPQVRVTDISPPAILKPFAHAKVIVAPGPRPALPVPRVDAETKPCSGVMGGGHSCRATQKVLDSSCVMPSGHDLQARWFGKGWNVPSGQGRQSVARPRSRYQPARHAESAVCGCHLCCCDGCVCL